MMSFAGDLARAGTFGLAGLALSKKKKPAAATPQQGMSLLTAGSNPPPVPSLINSPTVY